MAAESSHSHPSPNSDPVRVYTDGCYDLVHYGHANSLRQAKKLGTYLITGSHADSEIVLHKGPPLSRAEERFEQLRAVRWVDQVMEWAPYQVTPDLLDQINCDFVVHGNDITTLSGGDDVYAIVKGANRYREVERTEGVSTTELVQRMLVSSKGHHLPSHKGGEVDMSGWQWVPELCTASNAVDPWVEVFHYHSGNIENVIKGVGIKPRQKVCYTYGAFDLFHVGHVEFLKKASQLTDYLVVGLMDDQTVNSYKGGSYPIMDMMGRLRSLVACRYVNAVVVSVPNQLTQEILDHFKPDLVVQGEASPQDTGPSLLSKDSGMLKTISSGSTLTSTSLMARILENRTAYVERNRRKGLKAEVH